MGAALCLGYVQDTQGRRREDGREHHGHESPYEPHIVWANDETVLRHLVVAHEYRLDPHAVEDQDEDNGQPGRGRKFDFKHSPSGLARRAREWDQCLHVVQGMGPMPACG